jgi:hypothetical protein
MKGYETGDSSAGLDPSWRRPEGTKAMWAHFVAADRLVYVKYTAAIVV